MPTGYMNLGVLNLCNDTLRGGGGGVGWDKVCE